MPVIQRADHDNITDILDHRDALADTDTAKVRYSVSAPTLCRKGKKSIWSFSGSSFPHFFQLNFHTAPFPSSKELKKKLSKMPQNPKNQLTVFTENCQDRDRPA